MKFLRCVVFATVAAVATAVHVSEVLMTQATLFGGLDKECTPNVTTTCEVNMVEAVAWVRAIKAGGTPAAFLPTMDRGHILTKLHPKDWGSNFDLLQKLGNTRGFLSTFSYANEPTLAMYSVRENAPRVLDNFEFPLSHNFRDVVAARFIDEPTSLHLVAARRRFQPLDDVAKMAATTMQWGDIFDKKNGLYKNTMVVAGETTPADMSAAMAKHGARPEIICRIFASTDSVELQNGTWLVNVKTTKTHLHRIQIHRLSSTSSTIVNVTLTTQPLELPAANRTDPQYVADRALMKAEALIAASNNPIQGSMAGPMPAGTAPDGAAMCRLGECPIGNLWADALRDATGTDIGVFSGSWLKGPGWAAGNVYLRDIYDSYGFIELGGTVTVLGLSLFELWNHSLAVSAFDAYMSTTEAGARHLLQVSGMRVKYSLTRADVNNRLVSIEVWDRALKEYRPLERLKKYTVSGPQYLMQGSIVHSLYLKAHYTGEVAFSPINQNVQNLLSQFIAKTAGTYTPGIFGRMIQDNASTVSMQAWNQAASQCAADFVMDTGIKTCVACPVGTSRAVGAAACVPLTSNELSSTVLIAIVAGCCVLALIAGIAAFFGVMRWQRHKRTRYCPKDPGAPIAAFFVTVRNEVAVRERFPTTAHTAFKRIEEAVSMAATAHKCFVARRLGAHFLVVGTDPSEAVRAVAAVQRAVEHMPWSDVLRDDHKDHATIAEAKRRATGGHRHTVVSGPRRSMAAKSSFAQTSARHTPRQSTHASPNPERSVRISETSGTPSRHSTTGQSSRRGRDMTPIVSAGMAFGIVTIDHDEDVDTWSYSGPVVDAAATVADSARPGQFLAMEALMDVAKGSSLGAEFVEFVSRRFVCPVTRKEKDILLFQMDSEGCTRRHYEDAAGVGESDTAGALTAALETAAGGLTSRTVGAVCWSVPALRSPKMFESRTEHAKQLEAVLEALADVCKSFQADLTCAMDGTFVGVVNGASARTAQVATTSTGMARAGVAAVQGAIEHRIVAGVASGASVAGALSNTVVISGVAVERARLLAAVAYACGEGPNAAADASAITVVVPGEMTSDLDPHFLLAAADAVAWPDHCLPLRAAKNPVCAFAVIEEKTMAEDEWLYQLAAATSGDPYAKGNTALREAVLGKSAQTDVSALQHPEPAEDGGSGGPAIDLTRLLFAIEAATNTPNAAPTAILSMLQDRTRTTCFSYSQDA